VVRAGFDSLTESDLKTLKVGVFTAFLLDVQHFKRLVWRQFGKFACCVLGQGTTRLTIPLSG